MQAKTMNELHNFKVGDRITVFNRTLGGKFIIEGNAEITKVHSEREDYYQVRFLRELSQYHRYVDPNGQENPLAYLEMLNQEEAK
jgi:hypothetical protein